MCLYGLKWHDGAAPCVKGGLVEVHVPTASPRPVPSCPARVVQVLTPLSGPLPTLRSRRGLKDERRGLLLSLALPLLL